MGHRTPRNAIATGGRKTIRKLAPTYSDLSEEVRAALHELAKEFDPLFGTDNESMLKIGRKLNVAKKSLVPYGQFLHWLKAELGNRLHPNTAGLYMRADRFCTAYVLKYNRNPNLGNLSRTSMYLLSGPDVPEELQFQILDRANREPVPYHEVKKLVDEALAPIRAERRAKKKADKTAKDAKNDSDPDPDPTPGPKDLSKEDFRDIGLRIIERLGQYEETDFLFDDISYMVQHHHLTVSIEARGHPRHFLQFDFRVPRPPKGYVPPFARNESTEGSKPGDPLGPYHYR